MPMIKNSTLVYVCSNCENSEIIEKELFDNMLKEFQQVQKYLDKIQVIAPDVIVNNILNYSKSSC
jgi:hypothetical protein